MKLFLTCLGTILCLTMLQAQDTLSEQKKKPLIDLNKQRKFIVVPSVYYTPETRWAFGGIALGFFRFNQDDTLSPISSAGLSIAYTMNDQMLLQMPFNLYFKQNLYRIHGDVDFYRYPYFFSGIGNDIPTGYSEDYSASFPRFQLVVLRKVWRNLYTGPRLFLQNTTMEDVQENGFLASGLVPGAEGGVSNALGWEIRIDKRDNVYSATKGHFIRTTAMFYDDAFASDFEWNNYSIDLRKYFNLGKDHVIAIQNLNEFNFGETPFNRMAQLGGAKIMRGYRKGTYRDQHLIAGQVEYRTPIWYFFGFNAFLGSGAVADEVGNFSLDNFRPSYGAGIRIAFNKKERIHLRFDYARGDHFDEFYFTIGEAF